MAGAFFGEQEVEQLPAVPSETLRKTYEPVGKNK
jgi:hypothetical protein